MAFLVLLERLTPVERAVFLLREVFEYEYGEISAILGQSEVNCRQTLSRARQHIGAMRPRFEAPREKQRDLLEQFLDAARTGNMERLLTVLSEDAVLYTDGGGKGFTPPEPIRGASKVARGADVFRKLIAHGLVARIAGINGQPGIVTYLNGRPHSAVTIRAENDRIQALYLVTNPEKLAHLPDLVGSESLSG
jgi:RNA polymerase sigma-70 factor, ECF subfamily